MKISKLMTTPVVLPSSALVLACLFFLSHGTAWAHGAEEHGEDASEQAGEAPRHAEEAPERALTNTMCPVLTDEAVDPDISVVYQGKKVYLCCAKYRRLFLQDPEAYLANLPQFAAMATNDKAKEEHGDGHEKGEAEEHDHESGHGGTAGLLKLPGKFHPLLVHFPIALILVAALAELLRMITRRPFFSETSRFLVYVAALSALFTVATGWIAGAGAVYPGELSQTLFLHRLLGTGAGVLILLTAGLGLLVRLGGTKHERKYRMVLFLAALAVGVTGHLGATLVYGTNYFGL